MISFFSWYIKIKRKTNHFYKNIMPMMEICNPCNVPFPITMQIAQCNILGLIKGILKIFVKWINHVAAQKNSFERFYGNSQIIVLNVYSRWNLSKHHLCLHLIFWSRLLHLHRFFSKLNKIHHFLFAKTVKTFVHKRSHIKNVIKRLFCHQGSRSRWCFWIL